MYFNKKQLWYFFAIYIVLFIILIAPTFISTQTPSEMQQIMEQNTAASQTATVTSIFNNNMFVAGLTLIPYIGWGWLIAVLYSTGVVVASYSQPWYFILSNPFAYIELAVYAYVVLRSIKLVHLFRQRQTRFTDLEGKLVVRKTVGVYYEIGKTVAVAIIVCTIVLLGSALVEYALLRGVVLID